ncbi:MAG: hypothetical protein LKF37_10065 [Lentilactobacillus diolivorans]|nr:hypothetical protein [Lentilactobacillus diolivorans]
MKLKGLVAGVVTLSFLGVGTFASVQQVNASTWYHGTPTRLHGIYQYKLPKGSALGFGTVVKISANKIEIDQSGMSERLIVNPTYQRIGKYYRIKGHRVKNGMYKSGKENLVMYRYNNHFSFISYRRFKQRGFSHVHYAQRVSKVRDGNW